MRISRILGLAALPLFVPGDKPCVLNCTGDGILTLNNTDLESGRGTDIAAPPPVPQRPPKIPEPVTQPASDELWCKCRNKGCALAWAMRALDSAVGPVYSPSHTTAQSPFTSQSDLQKWFWSSFPRALINPIIHDFFKTWGIGWALQDLGINPVSYRFEGGKNELFFIDHEHFYSDSDNVPVETRRGVDDQWYNVEGKWYRATGASFVFTINWEEGVIMGLNRKSPKYAARERTPKVENELLPALSQFSDVAWIGWDSVSKREGIDVKNLRYFISVGIDNADTKSVIMRALQARGWELSAYPGHTFEQHWPAGRAIMGSPNVQGFAYLLIQHKAQLDNMFISKLQVFHGETEHKNPCIVMHLSQPESSAPEAPVERRDEERDTLRAHVIRANL